MFRRFVTRQIITSRKLIRNVSKPLRIKTSRCLKPTSILLSGSLVTMSANKQTKIDDPVFDRKVKEDKVYRSEVIKFFESMLSGTHIFYNNGWNYLDTSIYVIQGQKFTDRYVRSMPTAEVIVVLNRIDQSFLDTLTMSSLSEFKSANISRLKHIHKYKELLSSYSANTQYYLGLMKTFDQLIYAVEQYQTRIDAVLKSKKEVNDAMYDVSDTISKQLRKLEVK